MCRHSISFHAQLIQFSFSKFMFSFNVVFNYVLFSIVNATVSCTQTRKTHTIFQSNYIRHKHLKNIKNKIKNSLKKCRKFANNNVN